MAEASLQTEARFHAKIIIERRDGPMTTEIISGNHSTHFFHYVWQHVTDIEEAHPRHRRLDLIGNGTLHINRRDVSYIVRFVPLERFQVYIISEAGCDRFLCTDDATEIVPWVRKQGLRIVVGSTMRRANKKHACGQLCIGSDGELAAALEQTEAHEKKRLCEDYEAMYVRLRVEKE